MMFFVYLLAIAPALFAKEWKFEVKDANDGAKLNDDGCPVGSTCLFSNLCCPLPGARPCNDGVHCCPSDTTCNVVRGTCEAKVSGSSEIVWVPWERSYTQTCTPSSSVNAVDCGDGTYCEDGTTCCELEGGGYGCCPYPNAICCEDKQHCCPNGYQCDLSAGQCVRGFSNGLTDKIPFAFLPKRPSAQPAPAQPRRPDEHEVSVKWSEKQLPIATVGDAENTTNKVCPDGQSMCADTATCCELDGGAYGCCPLPNAVCCEDKTHCCPSGTTCDVEGGRCIRAEVYSNGEPNAAFVGEIINALGAGGFPQLKERLAQIRDEIGGPVVMPISNVESAKAVPNQTCPDGQSMCADTATCCELESGGYGCCPLPSAVCCEDKMHCCPNGTQCDLESGRCIR